MVFEVILTDIGRSSFDWMTDLREYTYAFECVLQHLSIHISLVSTPCLGRVLQDIPDVAICFW